MDKAKFFGVVRSRLGHLTVSQVKGYEALLAACNGLPLDDTAYILATAAHETAYTMQPVKEAFWIRNAEAWRKRHLRYYPYYGRGYVQLTWEFNYKKATDYFQKVLGVDVDFVKDPDLVMQPDYAATIAVVGMKEGWFTGKDMDDYLDHVDESDPEDLREYQNARRIINGKDKARKIALIAGHMETALRAGEWPT